MKKIILVFIIVFFNTITYSKANETNFFIMNSISNNIISLDPNIKIVVSLYFGKGNDFAGRGFCKITVAIEPLITTHINTYEKTGSGTIEIVNNKLQLTIDKASLSAETQKEQFADDVFIIETDYVLDSELCTKLGVRSYVIKAGKYLIPKSQTARLAPYYTFYF